MRVRPRLTWGLLVGSGGAALMGAAALDIELAGSLRALFWFTLVVTVACAVAALGLLALARRTGLGELAILAAGLYAVSVLPMVHALTLPGVLYGPNPTTMFAVLIGLPAGILVATAHVLDGFGVLLAAGGLVVAYRRERGLTEVFAPVINRDPIVALRLGVTPQVDDFLAVASGPGRPDPWPRRQSRGAGDDAGDEGRVPG